MRIRFEKCVIATSRPSYGGEERSFSVCRSMTQTLKLALDNDLARLRPTGPDPIMMMSYLFICARYWCVSKHNNYNGYQTIG